MSRDYSSPALRAGSRASLCLSDSGDHSPRLQLRCRRGRVACRTAVCSTHKPPLFEPQVDIAWNTSSISFWTVCFWTWRSAQVYIGRAPWGGGMPPMTTRERSARPTVALLVECHEQHQLARPLIPPSSMKRLVKSILDEHGTDLRMAAEAHQLIQAEAEATLTRRFQLANVLAGVANRSTLSASDMRMVKLFE